MQNTINQTNTNTPPSKKYNYLRASMDHSYVYSCDARILNGAVHDVYEQLFDEDGYAKASVDEDFWYVENTYEEIKELDSFIHNIYFKKAGIFAFIVSNVVLDAKDIQAIEQAVQTNQINLPAASKSKVLEFIEKAKQEIKKQRAVIYSRY